MKLKISEYLIQALLIIFSVVLALFLNEYINNLKSNKDLKIVLENIEVELKANKKIVDELIPYHSAVLRNLESTLADSTKINRIKFSKGLDFSKIAPKGIYQNSTSQTAWEAAKLSGLIPAVAQNRLQLLSKTYEQQNNTFTPSNKIVDILASREFLDHSKAKENLILLYWQFNEIRGREITLQRFYAEALKELEEN